MSDHECRILLVEDDRNTGDLLRFALLSEGYAVELVRSADEGVRRITETEYDLVIADWRLEEGGDGLVVLNQAADLGLKTMMLSGYLFVLPEPDPRHEYVMKPVRPSELVAAIERLIGCDCQN